MASMRDIKRRKGSITSTQQITKAMKLVSTVKLQKSKTRAEEIDPYYHLMYKTVGSILQKTGMLHHPFMEEHAEGKRAVVLITSNRGLAGGYNSNVAKLVLNAGFDADDTVIYAIGRKGREIVERKGFSVMKEDSDIINEPLYSDAMDLCKELLEGFANGKIREIYVAYTNFKNTVTHVPTLLKLLPINAEEFAQNEEDSVGDKSVVLMNYEPSPEEALDLIIPKYMSSILYGALLEALASENGARMQAMDSATGNAQEMIDKLSLQYNRARQGSITQELTEIIAGAQAIS